MIVKAKSGKPKDTPLQVNIEDGQLVIRIGVDTLAFCALAKHGGPLAENERVTDSTQFTEDVITELVREEENGDTPLTALLDEMIRMATENGCIAIRTLKRKPRELY